MGKKDTCSSGTMSHKIASLRICVAEDLCCSGSVSLKLCITEGQHYSGFVLPRLRFCVAKALKQFCSVTALGWSHKYVEQHRPSAT